MTKIKLGIFSIAVVFLFLACSNTTNQNSNTNTNANANANTNTNTSQTSGTPTQTRTTDTLAETRALYADQCAICHKPDGSGGPTTVGKKKINAASLKSGGAVKDSDEELTNMITNGEEHEGMPAFKDELTPEQIKSLVQFIRTEIQKK